MKKLITLLVLVFISTTTFSQGHYNGSSFNPGDYFVPHAGFIIPVYYGYADMNYYNVIYTRQISEDIGTEETLLSDRIWGIGGYSSYWITPGKIGLMGRSTQNFAAKNRFSGTAVQFGVNFLLPSH